MDQKIIEIEVEISQRGTVMYSTELIHEGLGKHRRIRDRDRFTVETRARFQLSQWDEQWAKKKAREKAARERSAAQKEKEKAQSQATLQTSEARLRLESLENTLQHTLTHDDTVDWNSLKDQSTFTKPKPILKLPSKPALNQIPVEPDRNAPEYQPRITWLDRLSTKRSAARGQEAKNRYAKAYNEWQKLEEELRLQNVHTEKKYEEEVVRVKRDHRMAMTKWEEDRAEFRAKKGHHNRAIDQQRKDWLAGNRVAVEAYCDMVLSNSEYDECCPQEFELEYNQSNKILLVDYQLPPPRALPSLTEVKYVMSRKEFTEKHLPQARKRKLYDDLLYQITLRTIHELFEADTAEALSAVVFNGYVASIDKGTGKEANACVLSVQADREAFTEINLEYVDPKTCFRKLKGVGSTKLHSITPVPPLLTLSRDDSRFVADQGVVNKLDEGENLALMDWEEFEHLIREVFSKEFSQNGGEVKVTQASRDGGVDAIAFDPDPIKGGKIVIQAKRYTNPVGVSAVRDLYGTVTHEGAMKGILVTTSSYGPDAYKFASDKPITLLDGSHLLHILERHGHKTKIDLIEAKQKQGIRDT